MNAKHTYINIHEVSAREKESVLEIRREKKGKGNRNWKREDGKGNAYKENICQCNEMESLRWHPVKGEQHRQIYTPTHTQSHTYTDTHTQ